VEYLAGWAGAVPGSTLEMGEEVVEGFGESRVCEDGAARSASGCRKSCYSRPEGHRTICVRGNVVNLCSIPKNRQTEKVVRAGSNLAGRTFVDARITFPDLWRSDLLLVIHREQKIITEGDSFVTPFSSPFAN